MHLYTYTITTTKWRNTQVCFTLVTLDLAAQRSEMNGSKLTQQAVTNHIYRSEKAHFTLCMLQHFHYLDVLQKEFYTQQGQCNYTIASGQNGHLSLCYTTLTGISYCLKRQVKMTNREWLHIGMCNQCLCVWTGPWMRSCPWADLLLLLWHMHMCQYYVSSLFQYPRNRSRSGSVWLSDVATCAIMTLLWV